MSRFCGLRTCIPPSIPRRARCRPCAASPLTCRRGEIVGVVGESGCGKSVTASSILRVLPENAWHSEGRILFMGRDLLTLSPSQMRAVRGRQISMIFQDPMTSLGPLMRIGRQIEEAILQSIDGVTRAQARERALDMLRRVHIPDPESRYNCYPHELSGGMRQRVMIAIALSCQPKLVIADEPTTALDVTIQAQILDLLASLQKQLGTAVIMITHDLGVIAGMCSRVAVMYGGVIVEQGTVREIFYEPRHPYTWGLLRSIPKMTERKDEKLIPINGTPPDMLCPPKGCPFAPRCPYAMPVCRKYLAPNTVLGETHSCACHLLHPNAPKVERGL